MLTALLLAGLAIVGQDANDTQPRQDLAAEWVIDARAAGAVVRPGYRLGCIERDYYTVAVSLAGAMGLRRVGLRTSAPLSSLELRGVRLEATVQVPGRRAVFVNARLEYPARASARLFTAAAAPEGAAIVG